MHGETTRVNSRIKGIENGRWCGLSRDERLRTVTASYSAW